MHLQQPELQVVATVLHLHRNNNTFTLQKVYTCAQKHNTCDASVVHYFSVMIFLVCYYIVNVRFRSFWNRFPWLRTVERMLSMS